MIWLWILEKKQKDGVVNEPTKTERTSGTQVTLDDINALKAPTSMVCVGKSDSTLLLFIWQLLLCRQYVDRVSENDQLFPDEVREEGRKSLKANGVEHEIEIYKDMPHGMYGGPLNAGSLCLKLLG